MGAVALLAGLVLLTVLIVDVFGTVFVPRGGAGIVTSRVYRTVWAGWSRAAGRAGHQRRRILALAGPVLLPLTVAVWVAELVVAFALLYLPFADRFSVPVGGSAAKPLAALYVSAYSATTLGVGDIYPTGPALRLLSTLEAGMGFALFSVAITYVLSVYGALLRATAAALQITSFVGREAGEDAVDVVCRTVQSRGEEQTLAWLRQTVSELTTTEQARAQYPLIAYFHIPRDDRALPLALGDLLDLVTVCRSLPEPSDFPALTSSPTMMWASRMVIAFTREHADQLSSPDSSDEQADLSSYLHARRRLQSAGVPLRDDEQARPRYLQLRREWAAPQQALLGHFGYDAPASTRGRHNNRRASRGAPTPDAPLDERSNNDDG